jgi:hypothetical protein
MAFARPSIESDTRTRPNVESGAHISTLEMWAFAQKREPYSITVEHKNR